jgi:hypothetical protein
MAILMTRAGLDEGVAAPHRLGPITPPDLPRRETMVAAMQEHHHDRDAWMAKHRAGWRLAVQTRPEGMQGVTPLEKRGGLARTNAWQGRYRRHRKDDERSLASSTAMLPISHIHLLLVTC